MLAECFSHAEKIEHQSTLVRPGESDIKWLFTAASKKGGKLVSVCVCFEFSGPNTCKLSAEQRASQLWLHTGLITRFE